MAKIESVVNSTENLKADLSLQNGEKLLANLEDARHFGATLAYGSVIGVTDNYEMLNNKPSIEEITLSGNKTFEDLGLVAATKLEIETILQS